MKNLTGDWESFYTQNFAPRNIENKFKFLLILEDKAGEIMGKCIDIVDTKINPGPSKIKVLNQKIKLV